MQIITPILLLALIGCKDNLSPPPGETTHIEKHQS